MIRKAVQVLGAAVLLAVPLTGFARAAPAMAASRSGVPYINRCGSGQSSKPVIVGGHWGYLRCNSYGCNSYVWYLDTDGNASRDEAFGIAPSGAVYHAWLGGPGWQPLKGG